METEKKNRCYPLDVYVVFGFFGVAQNLEYIGFWPCSRTGLFSLWTTHGKVRTTNGHAGLFFGRW